MKSQVGNSIDADGAYGAQCVDLIRAYYNFLGVAQVRGNGCASLVLESLCGRFL